MASLQSQGLVAEGQRGHRRGIVLGFTMAELMLLLLFCLLLVSASILLTKTKTIEAQQAQIDALTATQLGGATAGEITSMRGAQDELSKLLALLYPAGIPELPPAKVDALWKQLVLARDAQAALTEAGVSASPEVVAGLAELQKSLQDAGADQAKINAAVATLAALSKSNLTQLPPETVAALAAALLDADGTLDANKAALLKALVDALTAPGAPPLTQDRIAQIASDVAGKTGEHSWPPIISLDDDGNRFEVGSADIKPAFRKSLQNDVASKVLALLDQYDVDVIEIIGHTDEQVITPTRDSNLDASAIAALNGKANPATLIPVDNAGLGLARAIAVADVLKATGKFSKAKLVPLSAAQLMLPGDKLSDGSDAGNDRARRRIEIRVRRTTANLTN